MSDTASPELMRAYRLIEEEDLEQARTLLDSYLERNSNNPDAWWLYAHAVTDPAQAQDALRSVLRLNPNYPGAKALLAESETALSARTALPRLTPQRIEPVGRDRVPDFLDQIDDDDDFDTSDDDYVAAPISSADTRKPGGTRRLLFILVPILIAVIVLGIVIALVNNFGNRPTVTPTSIAVIATDVPDSENPSEPTQEAVLTTAEATADVTEENIGDPSSTLGTAFAEYEVQSVNEEETSLGDTLIVAICNDLTRGLPTTTLSALDILAQESANLSNQHLAVRVLDCENGNTPLRTVGVSLEDAQDFSAGVITATEFRSRLLPLR